jgi:hypothetical protein
MKTLKNSLLAIALITLFSVSLTSCGGDESEDPKPNPNPTKTDLEKVKENIVGVEVITLSAVVNGVTIEDLCTDEAEYANSVESYSFYFKDATTVQADNECVGGNFEFDYTITQSGDVFTVQFKQKTGAKNLVVDATFNKADFIDSNGKLISQPKGTFKEIASPKMWVGSPVVTLKKQ